MFGPFKNVVFDFDGTLVDTMSSVVAGLTEAVRVGTGRVVPRQELVATFGGSPLTVLKHWVSDDRLAEAFQAWIDFENQCGPEDMQAFPGVEEMLDQIKSQGIHIGIFTGRDRAGTLRIAKSRGWVSKYFSEDRMVCGDDGFAAKPSGQALIHLLKIHSWNPLETLMVGDHPYDMRAGREAQTRCAAALWDRPSPQKVNRTQRSIFKEAWDQWSSVDHDLRLDDPLSLARMFSPIKG